MPPPDKVQVYELLVRLLTWSQYYHGLTGRTQDRRTEEIGVFATLFADTMRITVLATTTNNNRALSNEQSEDRRLLDEIQLHISSHILICLILGLPRFPV